MSLLENITFLKSSNIQISKIVSCHKINNNYKYNKKYNQTHFNNKHLTNSNKLRFNNYNNPKPRISQTQNRVIINPIIQIKHLHSLIQARSI